MILGAADSAAVRRFVRRYGMQLGAKRFVAGESAEEFLEATRDANASGFCVAGGILGEAVSRSDEAGEATQQYCRLLDAFAARGLDANVAFKPTHVGLEIDPDLAYHNAASIATAARARGNTTRLDMEQSAHTSDTIDLYRRLRERFDNVGVALQSYLFRSQSDLESILELQPNVRIVKGAYLEPPSIAFANKRDVDASYVRLVETALSHPGYTAIATHDHAIVAWVKEFASRNGLPKRGRFEFQMLYGVAAPLAGRLIECGYRVRLAIPFGSHWFPYLMRRLAERPANVAFFLKGAFSRG
jgi:proline dehydrogenase